MYPCLALAFVYLFDCLGNPVQSRDLRSLRFSVNLNSNSEEKRVYQNLFIPSLSPSSVITKLKKKRLYKYEYFSLDNNKELKMEKYFSQKCSVNIVL